MVDAISKEDMRKRALLLSALAMVPDLAEFHARGATNASLTINDLGCARAILDVLGSALATGDKETWEALRASAKALANARESATSPSTTHAVHAAPSVTAPPFAAAPPSSIPKDACLPARAGAAPLASP